LIGRRGGLRVNRQLVEALGTTTGKIEAIAHVDETHAVEPLERTSEWEIGGLPETYPGGV
jgi:hypothetical protein